MVTEMVRMTREYRQPGQWLLTWESNKELGRTGAAWANFATLLNVPSVGEGLPEITSLELTRLADKRFGQILLVSTDLAKIDSGLSALQANGVQVVEREHLSSGREADQDLRAPVEILSRPSSP
jgi:hypothetical protein